jgi:hypothetical protein
MWLLSFAFSCDYPTVWLLTIPPQILPAFPALPGTLALIGGFEVELIFYGPPHKPSPGSLSTPANSK